MEYTFSEEMSGAHTWAEADLDMFTLARNLYSGNLAILWQLAQLASLCLFNSHDIFNTGVEILVKKVNEFNQVYIQDLCLIIISYFPLDIEDLASFIDIQDFTNAIGDRLNNIEELNSTFNMPFAGQEALSGP